MALSFGSVISFSYICTIINHIETMILEAPKTKEDFEQIKTTIEGLIKNPHADKGMIENLKVRLSKVEEELKKF